MPPRPHTHPEEAASAFQAPTSSGTLNVLHHAHWLYRSPSQMLHASYSLIEDDILYLKLTGTLVVPDVAAIEALSVSIINECALSEGAARVIIDVSRLRRLPLIGRKALSGLVLRHKRLAGTVVLSGGRMFRLSRRIVYRLLFPALHEQVMVYPCGDEALAIMVEPRCTAVARGADAVDFEPQVVLEQQLALFGARAQAKGIALSIAADETIPRLLTGDKERLSRLLRSLIENALQVTAQGSVSVKLDQEAAVGCALVLRWTVADTGSGIDADTLDALMGGGRETGVGDKGREPIGGGLLVARWLSERLRGRLTACSVQGQGSRFELLCPVLQTGAALTRLRGCQFGFSDSGAHKGRIVLVVEDNRMSRTLAVEHLRVHGFWPLEASCAAEALQKIRAGGIDALLLGTTLPDMDGCEVARLIRLHSSVPIIALSAYGAERYRQRFVQAGIDEVLEVPVDGMRLIQVLARWFSLAEVRGGEELDGDGLVPVFDGDAFLKRSMNELSIVAHLVSIFVEEMPERQQTLAKALKERDMGRVQELAHSLKGCAATISAERLRALAQRVERSAREDVPEKVGEYLHRLDKESQLFEEASRTFLASHTCGGVHQSPVS